MGFTHWSKELKEASDRLASNASRIAVVDQCMIAAQAFKKSIDNDDKLQFKNDAANALRNALIDVDPVPHSTQIQGLQSAEGISVILLLHAFLMYFFDIRGVRSPRPELGRCETQECTARLAHVHVTARYTGMIRQQILFASTRCSSAG